MFVVLDAVAGSAGEVLVAMRWWWWCVSVCGSGCGGGSGGEVLVVMRWWCVSECESGCGGGSGGEVLVVMRLWWWCVSVFVGLDVVAAVVVRCW